MPRCQRSKRARAAKKAAHFAGLSTLVGHPSHISGRRYNPEPYIERGARLVACGRISPDGRAVIRTAAGVQIIQKASC